MKVTCLAVACAVGLTTAVLASEVPGPPKPGPEHAKLGYFVGKWAAEGEMKASPFGPGGKTSSSDTCEWFEGKFAVVCNYNGSGPMGPMKGIGILGYSPEEKAYTYYGVDSSVMTMTSVPKGTKDGGTWTYLDESKMGGQTMKSRYVIEELSADSYTFKWEVEGEGGAWTTVMEGKSTKKK